MLKRLSNGLLSPRETARYYSESFGKAILYFIILIVLITIPTIVSLVTADIVPNSLKNDLKEAFLGEKIPFVIEDGVLVNIDDDETYVYLNENLETFDIQVTENIDNAKMNLEKMSIVLVTDGVYIKYSVMSEKLFEYSKYEYLKNLDLSDVDQLRGNAFWNNIFDILYQELHSIRWFTITVNAINNILYSIMLMLAFTFIITLFSKFRTGGYLKFFGIFKVTIYNLTPFIFCLIFSILFNLHFLTYIGYIISAIYNLITISEILKRLYLNRNEGE